MSIDWEVTFRRWKEPSSDTESQRAENSVRMIKEAVRDSSLSQRRVTVFIQGSYRNNTNVKQDSDVDICVCCNDLIVTDYTNASGMDDKRAGLVPATYTYTEFKNDVKEALIAKFGYSGITEGDKAFDVHENSYRIDADVVPAKERRLYSFDGTYIEGTQIVSKKGVIINNWPEQHYNNGVNKNNNTNYKFKFITRAIKRLKYHMVEKGINSAKPIPSYLVECLTYLVPDSYFTNESYKETVQSCLAYLWDKTKEVEKCKNETEINRVKYLFHSAQKWNTSQANQFLLDAWNYIASN